MRRLILWSCFLCLAGCASVGTANSRLFLSPTIYLDTLSLPLEMQNKEQIVFVTFQDSNNYAEFLVATSYLTNQMSMVFMTPEGLPLTEFTYAETGVIVQKDYQPSISLRPEYIVANLQLVLWPIEALEKALTGAVITETNDLRELTEGGKLVMAIQYEQKTIKIRNIVHDFTMTITEVDSQ